MTAGATSPNRPGRSSSSRAPDDDAVPVRHGLARVGRTTLTAVAIGAAFVLGTIVLRVASGDLRDPIELAAVPDLDAAQGTGAGFHEVDGARVERLDPATTGPGGSTADASTSRTGGASPTTSRAGDPTTSTATPSTEPGSTGGPRVAVPPITTPTVTTPTVTTPPVALPPVTIPPISLPTVSLPPIGEPLPPPPTISIPPVSLPPVTLPDIDPTPPITLPTLPPVTLPPLFPSAVETP